MSVTAEQIPGGPRYSGNTMTATLMLAVGVIGLVIGLIAAWPKFIHGGAALSQGSDMMWGLPVVTYAFLALSSFGVSMVAGVGAVFRIEGWDRIAPRLFTLALGLSIGALAALALELGHAFRTLWAIPLNMQIRSPMLWMGAFWGAYVVFLVWLLLRLRQVDIRDNTVRMLSIAIVLTCVGALFTQGLVYGMMVMRPVWYGAATPLYYWVGSVVTGLGMALLFLNITHRFSHGGLAASKRRVMERHLPVIFLVALVGYAIVVVSRTTAGLWSSAEGVQIVYQYMVASPLFWFEILICLAVPIVFMSMAGLRGNPLIQTTAGALAIVGIFIARYEFIVGGQLVPLWKGSWIPALVEYSPNSVEWGMFLIGVFLAITVYAAGDRFFNTGPHRGD